MEAEGVFHVEQLFQYVTKRTANVGPVGLLSAGRREPRVQGVQSVHGVQSAETYGSS